MLALLYKILLNLHMMGRLIRNAIRQDIEFNVFVGWRYRLFDLPKMQIGYSLYEKN